MSEIGQSAWVNWSETMMKEHRSILISIIDTLGRIPRFPMFILENDVHKLTQIARALSIQIPEDSEELYDIDRFNHILGECKKEIWNFMHTELRPSDPILDKLEKLDINKNSVDDIMEVGKGEL